MRRGGQGVEVLLEKMKEEVEDEGWVDDYDPETILNWSLHTELIDVKEDHEELAESSNTNIWDGTRVLAVWVSGFQVRLEMFHLIAQASSQKMMQKCVSLVSLQESDGAAALAWIAWDNVTTFTGREVKLDARSGVIYTHHSQRREFGDLVGNGDILIIVRNCSAKMLRYKGVERSSMPQQCLQARQFYQELLDYEVDERIGIPSGVTCACCAQCLGTDGFKCVFCGLVMHLQCSEEMSALYHSNDVIHPDVLSAFSEAVVRSECEGLNEKCAFEALQQNVWLRTHFSTFCSCCSQLLSHVLDG